MRVEFHQGVPEGCTEWLNTHVGRGNITNIEDSGDYAWFYERVEQEIPSTDPSMDSNVRYIPTIKVKDPKLAMLFALRWS
jgi:hypothetical protein